MNAREAALKVLLALDTEKAFVNNAAAKVLENNNFSDADRRFIYELIYGCVKNRDRLDCHIMQFSKLKLRKMSPSVRNILELGTYQIVFLSRVPDSAACDESAKLAKKYAYRSVGFINGILRNISRNKQSLKLPGRENLTEYMSVVYSCPEWMVNALISDHGAELAEEILKDANMPHRPYIRRNKLIAPSDDSEFIRLLSDDGIDIEAADIENCFVVSGTLDIKNSKTYKGGLFSLQNRSSQLAVLTLDPKPGETVIDVCAAPGGKTTYIAELMENKGSILAFDIHPHKIKLIENAAKRLGIDIISASAGDASKPAEKLFGAADRVLCDVPCSGLGVMYAKPDIKRYRKESDIAELTALQGEILDTASLYVRSGGTLVYSTCTILKDENERRIKAFLENNDEFTLEVEHKLFTHIDGGSGFYIAKLKKHK